LITSAIGCGLMASLLLALSKTDLSCRLLPDSLTILLVASGLLFHGLAPQTLFMPSLIGAAVGYLLLWGFATLYERVRGQAGMGRGDFAMFAGLGAWLGWSSLPMVLVTACIIGILIGVYRRAQILRTDNNVCEETLLQQQIAFGPALAVAGLIGWVGLV
jgi:leader peptidase (prepilin peptidase)/N-methyltransferase